MAPWSRDKASIGMIWDGGQLTQNTFNLKRMRRINIVGGVNVFMILTNSQSSVGRDTGPLTPRINIRVVYIPFLRLNRPVLFNGI